MWMALACVPVSLAAFSTYGMPGVIASVAAAGCCLAGAVPPLVLIRLLPGPAYALHHLGLGMLFRMGIPLTIGLLGHTRKAPWAESGFLLALVAYFLVGLVFDTLNMLAIVREQSPTTARWG